MDKVKEISGHKMKVTVVWRKRKDWEGEKEKKVEGVVEMEV